MDDSDRQECQKKNQRQMNGRGLQPALGVEKKTPHRQRVNRGLNDRKRDGKCIAVSDEQEDRVTEKIVDGWTCGREIEHS